MDSKILTDIDRIVSRINTHPEYSACARCEEDHALREEAEKHSLEIELINEGRRLTLRERSSFLSRLNGAYDLLSECGKGLYTISRLGPIIEPSHNLSGGFRNEFVSFGGFQAPAPEKIPYLIRNVLDDLDNSTSHPVVRAANSHLSLVEIHPFMDGNGRSARVLQNFCLQERSYPPAVIPTILLRDYIDIMHRALDDRYALKSFSHAPSIAEQDFYDFIGHMVFESAMALESELLKRRMYFVHLTKIKNPGAVRVLENSFRDFGRHNNHDGVCVSTNGGRKRRSRVMSLVGNISKGEVEKIVASVSRGGSFKYDLGIGPYRSCSE